MKHSQYIRHAISVTLAILFLLPTLAFAESANDVFGLSGTIYDLLDRIGALFWLLAMMFFFWGIVKFIANASDTAEHEKGKQFIVWGLISFVVLVSLWAIVELVLSDTIGIGLDNDLEYIDSDGNIIN